MVILANFRWKQCHCRLMLLAMVYKQVQIEANNYLVARDIKRIMTTEQNINLIKT